MTTPHRPTHHNRPPAALGRGAFTLIELVIVISIIALLIALLVPAVRGAITKARIAQVRTEIGSFDKAIADFKVKYGVEPPSSITIPEDPTNWTPPSKAKIRKIFGAKFDFTQTFDLNGNGMSETHDLNGAQCLLFFLAGPVDGSGVPRGFSKNPSQPFKAPTGSEERISFLSGLDGSRVQAGGTAMPVYNAANNYGAYLYIRADDYDDTAGTGALLNVPPSFAGAYRQGITPPAPAPPPPFWMPQSYQIICAGPDLDFGIGGDYDPDSTTTFNEADRDNITNFASGQLAN